MSYTTHADLGGHTGHGRVVPEPEGELWHAAWEPRAMALIVAMAATGSWNIDMSRSVRETLPDYAALSYYQIWTAALEKLLIERRMLRRAELRKAAAIDPPIPVARVLRAENVAAALAHGSPTERPSVEAARFAVGDRVRTRKLKVSHHTRLPGYVQGRVGSIERVHGMHVFADPHAHGLGEQPQWLYTVVFDAAQLWPGSGPGSHSVSVDAWQPYLEPAGADA